MRLTLKWGIGLIYISNYCGKNEREPILECGDLAVTKTYHSKKGGVCRGKKILILFILTFLFPTPSAYAQTKENPPIIHFAYAQENIRQGDVWKIYLSVSDPSNNMSRIVCRIEQDGGARHRPSVLHLKKGMQSGFTGYFALYTNNAGGGNLWGDDWTLQFTFVDRGGNEMKTLQFPLKFDGGG